MDELNEETIHLIVTSSPYYNAAFDYPNLFDSYNEFLALIEDFSKEVERV